MYAAGTAIVLFAWIKQQGSVLFYSVWLELLANEKKVVSFIYSQTINLRLKGDKFWCEDISPKKAKENVKM